MGWKADKPAKDTATHAVRDCRSAAASGAGSKCRPTRQRPGAGGRARRDVPRRGARGCGETASGAGSIPWGRLNAEVQWDVDGAASLARKG